MALTDWDFRMATAGAPAHGLDMERRSIDLNKHAFDLNDAPLNLSCMAAGGASLGGETQGVARNGMGLYDASAMKLWPPRTGGWLELFHNMFGQESTMHLNSFARIPEISRPNSRSCFGEQILGRHGEAPKRSLHLLPEQQLHNKRTRFAQQHMFEKPILSKDFHTTFPCIPQLPPSCRPPPHFFQDPVFHPQQRLHPNPLSQIARKRSSAQGSHHVFEQEKIIKQTISRFSEQEKAKGRFERTLHFVPQPVEISRSFGEGCHRIPKQEEQTLSTDFQYTACCFPEQDKRNSIVFHGISEQNHRSSSFQEALPRCSLQEKRHSICEQAFQIRDQEKSGSIYRNNIEPTRYNGLPSFLSDTVTGQESPIQIIPSPGWLPVGWITEMKTRKAGITAGTKDKYYKDPISGHRFRSKNEVMSYLQTGRMSRYRAKAKLLEGTAPSPIMMMSQFVPRQEESPGIHKSIQFNPSTSFGVTLRGSSASLGHSTHSLEAFKSGVSKVVDCVSDIAPKILERRSQWSDKLTLEKISVKQENEVLPASIIVSHNATKALDVPTPVEGLCNVVQVKVETGEDPSILESTTIQKLQKPVDEVHQTASQIPSFPTTELPSEHYCSRKEGHDIQEYSNSLLETEEAQLLYARTEGNTTIACTTDTQFPNEMTVMGNAMQVTDVYSPFSRHEELDQAKWTSNKKFGSRRVTKLTPREGKELLVSLGRKLCWQFLESVNETALYECNKQDTMR